MTEKKRQMNGGKVATRKLNIEELPMDQIIITLDEYEKLADTFNIDPDALNNDVVSWAEFSMKENTSHEEIRLRALTQAVSNSKRNNTKIFSTLCYSYICKYNENLTEEFIKELVFLSSNVFSFEYYNRTHIEAVMNIVGKGRYRKNTIELINYYIANQDKLGLNNNFIIKLKSVAKNPKKGRSIIDEAINWNEIKVRNLCSDKFFTKHKPLFESLYTDAPNNTKK